MERLKNRISHIQIDGLVVMKLIKHCHEIDCASQGAVAQGALLGLYNDADKLEITHAFPFYESADDEDFQLDVLRCLRKVNVDYLQVGWYQSTQFGNFLSPQLLESHFAYQTSIEESVCLIFDTAKCRRGFLSLKAYRLTPEAIELYAQNEFSPDAFRKLNVSHETLFTEIPIVIKNSHLVNELLLELSEKIPCHKGTQFLDLASADVLEEQLKVLIDTVDDLNQECSKFKTQYQTPMMKQLQEKTRWLQKIDQENMARTAKGLEPLPEEDINKIFKPIVPPNMLKSLVLSGQILSTSDQLAQFSSQSMSKWFATYALQNAKNQNQNQK